MNLMIRKEKELQLSFSQKEKAEKLLSNLEKLKAESSVTDEQYESMKSSYSQTITDASSEIAQIKKGLSRALEDEEKTLETYKQELKNLEARFKVGELSADEYTKSEQKTKRILEKEQAKVSELKRLLDSRSSADVGGYAEAGGRKGTKTVSAGRTLPILTDIITNKKILFGIIGAAVVLAIVASMFLVGSEGSSAKDVMKQLPESESFFYADCKTLRADQDLAPIWEEIMVGFRGEYGTVHLFCLLEDNQRVDELYLYEGDLDLEAIRDELDESHSHKSRYMGVEIWKEEGYQWAAGLFRDKLIIGAEESNVREAIEVIKGEKASLYESNPEMARIVDMLPDGFLVVIGSEPRSDDYDDLEAMGTSMQKMNERKLKVESVFMFDDTYSAANAVGAIRSDLVGNKYLDNVGVGAQNRYVIATATCEMENWDDCIW